MGILRHTAAYWYLVKKMLEPGIAIPNDLEESTGRSEAVAALSKPTIEVVQQ